MSGLLIIKNGNQSIMIKN